MMESSKAEKRLWSNDADSKSFEPVLVRIEKQGSAPHDIHIDKDEFKIGRGRDNDEIILNLMISRRHCIFKHEGNSEWTIKDLSSTSTFINDIALDPGITRRVFVGDVIQFGECSDFRYMFTMKQKEEHEVKRFRMDEEIMDSVLAEQKTFAETQECQKKQLKDKLQTKQREQVELKQQLEELLKQQSAAEDDKEDLKRQITVLEGKIEAGNTQEKHLQNMYSQLLEKLESERVQFEAKLNEEKQKWQEALDLSKQEKEMLESKMKEQMERWREQQQAEWKSMMENRVKEEKTIQAQLMNEKTMLEEKLKETEKALKEKEIKPEITIENAAGSADAPLENCVLVEVLDLTNVHILDTIDLTECTQPVAESKDGVINKVSSIMDEQLTCSICSELFVKATTLNCTHTFCHHCINQWKKKRKECPVCRSPIFSMNRSLVLDNFIESMLENLPGNLKERRKELVTERKALERKKKIH